MVGIGAAIAIAGGASAGGSILGGLIGAGGAKSAASQQAQAAREAAMLEQQRYETTRSDLGPFRDFGQQALPAWGALPGQAQTSMQNAVDEARANIPGPMSQDWLEQQPGYQFTRDQGMKSLQSSATSRGLGVSGPAMAAGGNWVTNLANTYYKTAFDQAQTRYTDFSQQFSNKYNMYNALNSMYSGQAALGENAGAQVGTTGAQLAAAAGTNIAQAGQALAAGTATAANNIGGSIASASQLPLTYALLSKMGGLGNTNPTPPPSQTVYPSGNSYNPPATADPLNS